MYNVRDLILMVAIFHCISCHQLPWPAYDSASSASSHKAASNKYFHQNAYSNDGNKEEHSSTTYLDGHNSAGDNANAYSEPSLVRLQQPAKMLPYISSKLPADSYLTADSISPAPSKKHSFGDQLFSYFPKDELIKSFSLPKQPLLEIIPATISESLMENTISPVITIEPVLSVLKKPSSVMEYEPSTKQGSIGYPDILEKCNPVDGLIDISSQNLKKMYDKADTTDSEKVSSEYYKSNMGNPVFDLLDDDVYISTISSPEIDELIVVTEEAAKTDKINKDAEVITLIPSVLQSAPYGSIPMYSYIPNYYYMQPYPMMSIQPNGPSNEPLPAFGSLYDSEDKLSNDPVSMKELLQPELLYGNLALHNGMSPHYGPFIVQQYPMWSNYHQEASSNNVQGATASASPSCATSDSVSKSTSYATKDLKRL